MKRIADLLFMTAGGYAGWMLGAVFGIFVAFVLGMVGTGAGLWLSNEVKRRYLP